jgi:hypothetical protein
VDGCDRFSDLDLTFGIADDVPVAEVLDDWTRTLIAERDAVQLADLTRGPTTYRVFLLPDALQFDLSITPAAHFRPAGPRFRLLFGETAAGEYEVPIPQVAGNLFVATPSVAHDLFGWGVIYALHARVHRAWACLASRTLRRRRARPRPVACLPLPGTTRGTGARLRRSFRGNPCSIRRHARQRSRAGGAPTTPRRIGPCAHARGRRGASTARNCSRAAPF